MAGMQRLLPESHPKEALLQLRDLEKTLTAQGFTVVGRRWAWGLGFYCAQKSIN